MFSRATVLSAIAFSLLTACGGGGGGGDTNNPPTPAADTTPDAFAFTSVDPVFPATPVHSAKVTITGIAAAAPIEVSANGEYRIDDGAYTAVAGTVSNNQTVSLRALPADALGETATVTLTVGGVSAEFVVATVPAGTVVDTTPASFDLPDPAAGDVAPGETFVSAPVVVTGINATAPISVSAGAEYRIDGGEFTSEPGIVSPGQAVEVRMTAPSTSNAVTEAVLTIGAHTSVMSIITPPAAAQADAVPDVVDVSALDSDVDDVHAVAPGQVVTFGPLTASGIGMDVPISIAGGEYSIDGGATFHGSQDAPLTVADGTTVLVRVTASAFGGDTASATLHIGGVSSVLAVITSPQPAGSDTSPDPVASPDPVVVVGAQAGEFIVFAPFVVTGIDAPTAVSISGGEYAIAGANFTDVALVVTPGQQLQVRITAPADGEATSATLSVGNLALVYAVTVLDADNEAPEADAGADHSADEGTLVTLDGSATEDPEDNALSYSWTQTGGVPVVLTGADTPTPTFAAPALDPATGDVVLTFQLEVSDGQFASSDTVNVTIEFVNQLPIAHAGTDRSVDEGGVVTLHGGGSTDADGETLVFAWTQTAGPTVTLTGAGTAGASFTTPNVLSDTVLEFELRVTDGSGVSDTDAVAIEVRFVNQAPVASAGPDYDVPEGGALTLIGNGSDADGHTFTYAWTQTAGPTVTLNNTAGQNPSFQRPDVTEDTTLVFQLTVTDTLGATGTDTATAIIRFVNQPPLADAGADATRMEGQPFTIDGSASSEPDQQSLAYAWTVPAGFTVADPNAAVLSVTGTPDVVTDTQYDFTLTVTDVQDAAASDTATITLSYINDLPVANAGADRAMNEGGSLTLDGSASADQNGPLTYAWSVPGGFTTGATDGAMLAITATPNVTADTSYNFTLAVTDSDNVTRSDTAVVTVQFINQLPAAAISGAQDIIEHAALTLDASGSSDADADALSYAWTMPAGFVASELGAATLEITDTPDVDASTEYTFSVLVSDGRGGSDTADVTVGVAPLDAQPDAIAFSAVNPAPWSAAVVSEAVTIGGINVPVPLSLTGDASGEISINGGAFQPDTGNLTASNGDAVKLRLASAGTGSTLRTVTLVAGAAGEEVSATFEVTTEAEDKTPDPFTIGERTDVEPDTDADSDPVSIIGLGATASVTGIDGLLVSVNGGAFTGATTINGGDALVVRLTSSAEFGAAATGKVRIGDLMEVPYTVTTRAAVTLATLTPFADVSAATRSSTGHTATTTVGGAEVPVPVRLNGDASARFSVDGSTFFDSSKTDLVVQAGDTVTVRLDAAAGYNVTRSATVTVGITGEEVSATFDVTTETESEPPALSVAFPFNGAIANAAVINIRGSAQDNDRVSGLRIADAISNETLAETVPVGGEWMAQLVLAAGHNGMVIEATDPSGNVTQLPYALYRDSEPVLVTGDIALMSDGDAVIMDAFDDRLLRVDLATGERSLLHGPALGSGYSYSSLEKTFAVDVASNIAYVAASREIIAIDLDSGVRSLLSRSSDATKGPVWQSVVEHMDIDAGRNRLIISPFSSEGVFDVDLSAAAAGVRSLLTDNTMHADADPLLAVRDVAADIATGEIFIADDLSGVGLRIQVLSADGTMRTTISGKSVDATGNPVVIGSGPMPDGQFDLTVLDADTLLLVSASAVYHIDRTTGDRTEVSGPNRGTGPALAFLVGAVVDADGSYLLTSDFGLDNDSSVAPVISRALVVRVDPVTGNRTVVSRRAGRLSGTLDTDIDGMAIVSGNAFLFHSNTHVSGAMSKADLATGVVAPFVTSTVDFVLSTGLVHDQVRNRVISYKRVGTQHQLYSQSLADPADRELLMDTVNGPGSGVSLASQDLSTMRMTADGDFLFSLQSGGNALYRIALRDGYRSDGSGSRGDRLVVASSSDGQGIWFPYVLAIDEDQGRVIVREANGKWWELPLPDADGTPAAARQLMPLPTSVPPADMLLDDAGTSAYQVDITYLDGSAWVSATDLVSGGNGVVADNVTGNGAIADLSKHPQFDSATGTIWFVNGGQGSIMQLDPLTGDRVTVISR